MDVLGAHPVLEVQPPQRRPQGRADAGEHESRRRGRRGRRGGRPSVSAPVMSMSTMPSASSTTVRTGWIGPVDEADDLVAQHVGVGEEERCVEAVDQEAGHPAEVAVVVVGGPPRLVAGDAAEHRGVRQEGAPEDLEQRHGDADADARQDADDQHPARRHRGHDEVTATHAPEPARAPPGRSSAPRRPARRRRAPPGAGTGRRASGTRRVTHTSAAATTLATWDFARESATTKLRLSLWLAGYPCSSPDPREAAASPRNSRRGDTASRLRRASAVAVSMLVANTRTATLAPAPRRSSTSPERVRGRDGVGMPAATSPTTGSRSCQPARPTTAVAAAMATRIAGTRGAQQRGAPRGRGGCPRPRPRRRG